MGVVLHLLIIFAMPLIGCTLILHPGHANVSEPAPDIVGIKTDSNDDAGGTTAMPGYENKTDGNCHNSTNSMCLSTDRQLNNTIQTAGLTSEQHSNATYAPDVKSQPESEPEAEPTPECGPHYQCKHQSESERTTGADDTSPSGHTEPGDSPSATSEVPQVNAPNCHPNNSECNPQSETEPSGASTAEREDESHSEPVEPEDTHDAEPESGPELEPMPDWTSALAIWQEAWPIHVYLFGCLFLLTGIVTLFLFGITLSNWKRSGKKILTISLTGLLNAHNLTRAIVLLVDPYRPKILPYVLWRLLWVWTYPCLTSALCILLVVLVDTTKMTLGPPKFQKPSSIAGVVIGHFAIITATELIVYYFHSTTILMFLCQLLTALWGLTLVCSFGYILFKLSQNLKASHGNGAKDKEMTKILSMRRTILILTVVGAVYSGTFIYGAVGVFGVLNAESTVEPWPWWSFQTLSRIEELCMTWCILIVIGRTPAMANAMRGVLMSMKRKYAAICCVAAVPKSIQRSRCPDIAMVDDSGVARPISVATSNQISPGKASATVTTVTESVPM